LAQWLTASAPTSDGGYGSPLSRGRHWVGDRQLTPRARFRFAYDKFARWPALDPDGAAALVEGVARGIDDELGVHFAKQPTGMIRRSTTMFAEIPRLQ